MTTSHIASTDSFTGVVVGLSRRTGSPDAVAFALDEARRRELNVLAVTAWRPPRPPGMPGAKPPGFPAVTPAEVWDEEFERLSSRLLAHVGDDADRIDFQMRKGSPARVLLDASVAAALLVLDSPRAGNITTMAKSWIAPSVIGRARCPVVLMPHGMSARAKSHERHH